MEKNKVNIVVCSESITVIADDSPAYISKLASTVDKQINEWYSTSRNCNFRKAMIMTALQYCDESSKNKRKADMLTYQIKEQEKEIENLNKEIEKLKATLADMQSAGFETEKCLNEIKNENNQLKKQIENSEKQKNNN